MDESLKNLIELIEKIRQDPSEENFGVYSDALQGGNKKDREIGEYIAHDRFLRNAKEIEAGLIAERERVLEEFFGYGCTLSDVSDWSGSMPLELKLFLDDDHIMQGADRLLNSEYGKFVNFYLTIDTKKVRLEDVITEQNKDRVIGLYFFDCGFTNEDASYLVQLGVRLSSLLVTGYADPDGLMAPRYATLGDSTVRVIANAECMEGLKELSFRYSLFGDDEAIALAKSSQMENLEVLDISDTGVQDTGVYALMESGNLPQLYNLRASASYDCRIQLRRWNEQRKQKLGIV